MTKKMNLFGVSLLALTLAAGPCLAAQGVTLTDANGANKQTVGSDGNAHVSTVPQGLILTSTIPIGTATPFAIATLPGAGSAIVQFSVNPGGGGGYFEISYDGGGSPVVHSWQASTGLQGNAVPVSASNTVSPNAASSYVISLPAAATLYWFPSVGATTTLSNVTIAYGPIGATQPFVFVNNGTANPIPIQGVETAGSAVTGLGVRMMGSDGTNARDVALTTGGSVITAGSLISGSGTSTTGSLVLGFDGTNDRAIQTTTSGQIYVVQSSGNTGTPWAIQGNVASGALDSGNPLKVGCVFHTTAPTLTDAERGDCQMTARGYNITAIGAGNGTSLVTVGNGAADGISPTTGVLYTANFNFVYDGAAFDRLNTGPANAIAGAGLGSVSTEEDGRVYSHIASATTTVVKSGKGNLHLVNLDCTVASSTVTLYDNTAASGTLIKVLTCPATITGVEPRTIMFDVAFVNGLTALTSSADDLLISYR